MPNHSCERLAGHLTGADDPVDGEEERDILERDMGGEEHDAEPVAGEHHRHVDPAGEMRQPFGVTGKGKAGEMEGVFLGRRGHDGIDLAGKREAGRLFDRAAGHQASLHGAGTRRAAFLAPAARGDPVIRRDGGDLVLGPEQRDLGGNTGRECRGDDFGTDSARVAQRHREAHARCHGSLISM